MSRLLAAAYSAVATFISLAIVSSAECAPTSPHKQRDVEQPLHAAELDRLASPFALYPDVLLAQVLIASTYPLEVAEAARWTTYRSTKAGDLDAALAKQEWDASVKALAHTPMVLATMGKEIGTITKLGEAFLAQPADMMSAVQRLRRQALQADRLRSTPQQIVTASDTSVVIAPARPGVVYVPNFNPVLSYGLWEWDELPPYYWPPAAGYPHTDGFFSAPAAGRNLWLANVDWRHRQIEIAADAAHAQEWRYDPIHRHDMIYGLAVLQRRYGPGPLPGADTRQAFRGFDDGDKRANDQTQRSALQPAAFDAIGRAKVTRLYAERGFASRGSSKGFSALRNVDLRGY